MGKESYHHKEGGTYYISTRKLQESESQCLDYLSPVRFDKRCDHLNDILDIIFCHFRINGKRNNSFKYGTSHREIFGEIPVIIPIIGVKMQGDKMYAGSYALFFHEIDHFVSSNPQPFQVQLNDVEVPGMLHIVGHIGNRNFCNLLKTFIIKRGVPLPDRSKAVTFM